MNSIREGARAKGEQSRNASFWIDCEMHTALLCLCLCVCFGRGGVQEKDRRKRSWTVEIVGIWTFQECGVPWLSELWKRGVFLLEGSRTFFFLNKRLEKIFISFFFFPLWVISQYSSIVNSTNNQSNGQIDTNSTKFLQEPQYPKQTKWKVVVEN